MTKFGDLINVEIPVLIDFHTNKDESIAKSSSNVLKSVVAGLGGTAKVIKIDIQKNELLASSLKVEADPTFVIYKNGIMKWRESGAQDATTLIDLVQQYV